MFHHNLIELPRLEQINSPHGRRYKTPEGNLYPSVTTVLGSTSDSSALDQWRERVGEEEANKISRIASVRGTAVHELCEDYIMNRELRPHMLPTKMMFEQIKRVLDKSVDDIRLSEGRLYSDTLKVAGSVDLMARFNKKKATIDFKTSMKAKKREWIENYFLQVAMYSFMAYEQTGIFHNNMAIIIAVEDEQEAQVFEDKASNWIARAKTHCQNYHLVERSYGP
jgi:hypothetical protein